MNNIRWRVVGLGAAAVAAGGLMTGCATASDSSAGADPSAVASSSPSTAASASGSAPAEPSAGAEVGTQTLPPVDVGKDAVVEGGTKVKVTKVADVTLDGTGPGEIQGPGVAVTIKITNRSDEPLDLNGTAVTGYFGDAPASPSSAAPASALSGKLAPGKSATGVYVFQKADGAKGAFTAQIENTAWPQTVQVEQ